MLKNRFKNRINYLINYSPSKTSKENLIEQDLEDVDYDVAASDANPIEIDIKSKCEQPNVQPTECFTQSPQNLITPPLRPDGNCGSIKGFCYRRVHNNSGIFVPSNSKLYFWSTDEMLKFTEQLYEHYKSYNVVLEKNEIFKQMMSLIGPSPEKTLMQFKFTSFPEVNKKEIDIPQENYGRFNIVAQIENSTLEFLGFADKNTREYYISPKWKDIRTPYQKFVDEWGTVIQMSFAFATALLGFVSEGSTWLLTLEILGELGLGGVVGQREWEKGENVSAVFSLIFGAIPLLKTHKYLRSGITNETYKSISKKLLESKLTSKSDVNQYKSFYKKLTPPEKRAWTLILEQDAYTKNKLVKDISKTLKELSTKKIDNMFDEITKLIKTNPRLAVKNVEWWRKLWARETGTYTLFMVLAYFANKLYPEKNLIDNVSEEEKRKLEGIIIDLDEKLKHNLEYNLVNNLESLPELTKSKEFQELVTSKRKESALRLGDNLEKVQNEKIKKLFENKNLPYIEVEPLDTQYEIPILDVSTEEKENQFEIFDISNNDITKPVSPIKLKIDGKIDPNLYVRK